VLPGDIVPVEIFAAEDYDLWGDVVRDDGIRDEAPRPGR
jgi:hypothetical protein